MKTQKRANCKTCPWVGNMGIFGDTFDPRTLQTTIVADINEGRVQSCHADNHATFCAGALAFQKRTDTMHMNDNLQRGIEWGIINQTMIDEHIQTFMSVDEMLEHHGAVYDVQSVLFS